VNAPLLRLLPAALLLWVVPAGVGALRIILGFRQIADNPAAGTSTVAIRLVTGVAGLLWIGSALLLVAILGLAIWQRRWEREHPVDATPPVSPAWQGVVLVLVSLTILPAALVVYSTYSVTDLVAHGAMATRAVTLTAAPPGIDLQALTTAISNRLILSVTLGALTAAALAGFQLLNLFAIRPPASARLLQRTQWVIAAAVLGCGVGSVTVLTFHLRWLSSVT
jgi:hypothetical protein